MIHFFSFYLVASSNTMLNLSTFDKNKETEDHEDLSELINTPHSKLQNQPDMLRENEKLTCSDVDIHGYIIMHENQLDRKETTLENRLEKMIKEKSENEDDGFKKEYHVCKMYTITVYFSFIFLLPRTFWIMHETRYINIRWRKYN